MKKLDEILKNERIWGHEIMFPFHSALGAAMPEVQKKQQGLLAEEM